MRRWPAAARAASFALALVVTSGCDAEVIRLGCPGGRVTANEVAWVGDSWIVTPGTQHTRVRDLARAAGAIGPGGEYTVLAAPASSIAMIADQYTTQEAGAAKIKVLIMDGGTWDTLIANGSEASVSSAADGFRALLSKVASDGTVEHIVYYLMPELPSIAGVADLRPLVQEACAASTVSCHFLDLQPLWAGHPEYTASDGIQASEAGAQVIADAIWAVMQQSCIAQ